MKPSENKPSLRDLSAVKPKLISSAPQELIKQSFLRPDETMPLVIEPAGDVDIVAWARSSRAFLEAKLLEHGALLFRNFKVMSPAEFENFIAAVSGPTLEYRERSSPRTSVSGNIYTSTEYPSHQAIFPHNENSYAHVWPMKLFFLCLTPATEGGETPIADVRKVFRRIDPAIREKFSWLKVLYIRNFSDLLGLTWQTVFQTEDRAEVEAYCRMAGYQVEWGAVNRLRTRRVGQAIARHPSTNEPVWFNHAAFFHPSTLESAVIDALRAQFDQEDFPNNTCYGDGSAIEPEALDAIRNAYRSELATFTWRKGDILMLDNMLTAHARQPYKGPRRIIVGMSEPLDSWKIT
jgi:alpha-ketoglutarate-dependent taurine dioxygenase